MSYRTYAEYLRHPQFLAVRAEAFKRAGNRCEHVRNGVRCNRPATEPHHLHYPRWGTFDVPENLLVVCHKCHCELEGKER